VKKPDRHTPDDGACVKDRCEPAHIVQVAEVLAGARECSVQEVAEASRRNAIDLFLPWLGAGEDTLGEVEVEVGAGAGAGAGAAINT